MPTLAAPLDCAKLETRNERIHQLGANPSSPVTGQIYYNTGDNTVYWWNGTAWRSADASSGAGGPPTGAAGGDLLGSTYPNPVIAASVVTLAKCNASMSDQAAGTASLRSIGTTGITACAGNDSRLSDSRVPSGSAGGDLTGSSYPNPVIAALAVTDAKVATANKDGATGTFSMRTLGYSGLSAMPGIARLDQIAAPNTTVGFAGFRITGVADPTGAQDAATKNYVDTFAQGLDSHPSCRLATTANVTLVGGAPDTVDGITVASNDRILVKNQTTPAQNGIYSVTTPGTGATGTWVRAADQDTWAEVPSAYVWIETGSTQADTGWTCTSDAGGTLNTTAISWVQFSGAGMVIAGAGLTKTGNTLDVIGTANRITVAADSVDISTLYVGQASITTLGTVATGVWQGTKVDIPYGGTNANTATIARFNLGVPTWYATATHASGTTITIAQTTHKINVGGAYGRAIFMQASIEATGAIVLPDFTVDSSGNVTATFSASQSANTIRICLLGLQTTSAPDQPA